MADKAGLRDIIDYSIYRCANCPSCNVIIGAAHHDTCSIARCMLCGMRGQTCLCCYRGKTIDGLASHRAKYAADVAASGGPDVWSGSHPDEASCIALGLYARWIIKARGFFPCGATHIHGHVDVVGLSRRATWDVAARAWVAKAVDASAAVEIGTEEEGVNPVKAKVKRGPRAKMGKRDWPPKKVKRKVGRPRGKKTRVSKSTGK